MKKFRFKVTMQGVDWDDTPVSMQVELTAPNAALAFHETMHQWPYRTVAPPSTFAMYCLDEVEVNKASDRVISSELLKQAKEKTDAS